MPKPIFVVHLIHTISREKFNCVHNKVVEELKDKDIEALIKSIKNE